MQEFTSVVLPTPSIYHHHMRQTTATIKEDKCSMECAQRPTALINPTYKFAQTSWIRDIPVAQHHLHIYSRPEYYETTTLPGISFQLFPHGNSGETPSRTYRHLFTSSAHTCQYMQCSYQHNAASYYHTPFHQYTVNKQNENVLLRNQCIKLLATGSTDYSKVYVSE